MNIYISHSSRFDFKVKLYDPLKNSSLYIAHNIIFPHDKSGNPYPTERLLKERKIDIVLAEVSHQATGQGIELGWAYIFKIPIICIYELNSPISNSLKLISKNFIPYHKINADMFAKIEQMINKLNPEEDRL